MFKILLYCIYFLMAIFLSLKLVGRAFVFRKSNESPYLAFIPFAGTFAFGRMINLHKWSVYINCVALIINGFITYIVTTYICTGKIQHLPVILLLVVILIHRLMFIPIWIRLCNLYLLEYTWVLYLFLCESITLMCLGLLARHEPYSRE